MPSDAPFAKKGLELIKLYHAKNTTAYPHLNLFYSMTCLCQFCQITCLFSDASVQLKKPRY